MNVVLQVLLALLIPIGWGLLSAYLFDKYRERRALREDCALQEPEIPSFRKSEADSR
ncbi:MAG: hypothetical protein GX649_05670 [Chloroflexi bacterium]|nr:hypothetical protein [Chloroflexota bacterium]